MYGEDGTGGIATGELQFAMMGLGDPLGDGKSEAGAAAGIGAGASLIGAEESFEDARLELRGDAGTIVGNGKLRAGGGTGGGDSNFAACRCVLDGVVE